MPYRVILENNQGCQLDVKYAESEKYIDGAILALIKNVGLTDGDVIRIIMVEQSN